ncbi:uncharacterized protein LOC143353850 [Halictus rubicundus]|uniref:uncharacterized protein LOC143353850 n=1 Tax=Halictus rubicundus TaxID=77578 RepID=UPI0040370F78
MICDVTKAAELKNIRFFYKYIDIVGVQIKGAVPLRNKKRKRTKENTTLLAFSCVIREPLTLRCLRSQGRASITIGCAGSQTMKNRKQWVAIVSYWANEEVITGTRAITKKNADYVLRSMCR